MKLNQKNTALSLSICILTTAIFALVVSTSQAGIAVNVMRTLDNQLVTAEGVCSDGGYYEAYPTQVFAWTFQDKETYFYHNHPAIVSADLDLGNDLYSSDFQYLPANTALHFAFETFELSDATTNLAYWDGNGEVNFSPISDGTVLGIVQEEESTFINGSATKADGFDLGITSSGGGIHAHPAYGLENNGAKSAEGVYLWCMELSMQGMETTEPYFIVMNTPGIESTALDAAEVWVNNNINLLTSVPEPSGLVLLAGVGIAMVWRRKKNQK